MQEKAIKTIISGRKIGTFFTESSAVGAAPVEVLAENGMYNLHFNIFSFEIFSFRLLKTVFNDNR